MRKIVLVAAIAGAALSLAACSESTEDAAGDAADSAMADAEAVDDAAADVGEAADATVQGAEDAAAEAEAEVQDETTTEAAAD